MSAADTPKPTMLFGREPERLRLHAALDQAIAGRGQLVMLSGEAGIGKTALVDDLVQSARQRGTLVLTGACFDLTTTPPYGAWVEMARTYRHDVDDLPRLPSFLQSNQGIEQIGSQGELFELMVVFLAELAARAPLVVLLEDLHWSDDAGLDLLRYVARRTVALRLLLVVTYRDDEVARRHPLAQVLPLLVREAQARRIELRRLDTTAVQQWVAARYQLLPDDEQRLVQYLELFGEGNPLYIAEVLRTLEAERSIAPTATGWQVADLSAVHVPPLLRQVIDGRLGRLAEPTRDALALAAVIGDEVSLDVWEAVGGLEAATLDRVIAEALDRHVLVEPPGRQGLRFSHALVREVLYQRIVPTRRRIHHRLVAEALAETPNPDPDAVAHHFQQAQDERAIEWLVRAGLRALRSAAWFTAADRFRATAWLLDGDQNSISERGWLLFYACFLLRFSGDPQTLSYLDEAERLAVAANDPLLEAYNRYVRGTMRCHLGDIRRGVAEIDAGVVALDALAGSHHLTSTDEQARAAITSLLPEGAAAGQIRDAQLQLTASSPNLVQQRGVLVNWLGTSGQYREALKMGEVFLDDVIAAFGDDHLQLSQCVNGRLGLGHAYAGLGRPGDAEREYRFTCEGFAIYGDHAMVEYASWVQILMVILPYRTEHLAERVRLIAEAARAWSLAVGMTIRGGAYEGIAPHCQLLIDLLEGRWVQARRLAQAGRSAPNTNQFQGAIASLAMLARNQGQRRSAWALVYELHPDGPATEPGDSYFPHAITAQALACELALDAGDLDTARDWIEAHARWLKWSGAVLWQADHQLLRARFHELSGDLDRAWHHAEAALALASEPRQPLRLIAAYRMLGDLTIQEKRFVEAEEFLRQSVDLANACAAPFERALSLLALAELRVATNRSDEAQTLLAEVRAICTPLDARPTLERVDALEIEISAQASSAPTYPDGLTEREVEVLHLIAAGKSNREMAELLYITTRTVERHIANIYLKIDAHNRVEAAAYAARHNLTAPPSA